MTSRNAPSPPFLYGRQPILEALKSGSRSLHKLWLLDGSSGDIIQEILQLARAKGIPLEWAKREQLDKRVQGHHQGVVAEASAATFLGLDDFLRSLPSPFPGEGGRRPGEGTTAVALSPTLPREGGGSPRTVLIALDEIQDPHNIGAILRSAGFFGIAGALVPKWRTAPVGETAARVSSGAIEHVPLIRVTNLAQSILELQAANFEVIGADMTGDPIASFTPGKRVTIVFGSEGSGLRRLVRERCDKLLAVPGAGRVGSLNVAAAAAIFLYEFSRPRSTKA